MSNINIDTKNRIECIDLMKFIFALLIPTLHFPLIDIGGEYNSLRIIIAQYIARLGVPFFFASTGYFLAIKLEDYNKKEVEIFSHYFIRLFKLFAIWFLIDLPFILMQSSYRTLPIDKLMLRLISEIFFKCPAYLWYLVAVMVASLLFIYSYRKIGRKIMLILSIVLYLIGVSGNTYLYVPEILKVWEPYLDIFITTRNGIFFAFPFMYFGAIFIKKQSTDRSIWIKTLIAYFLFCIEVNMAKEYYYIGGDCSMYITLPIVTLCLLNICILLKKNSRFSCNFRKMSTWLYCSQYIGITFLVSLVKYCKITILYNSMLIWLVLVALSLLFYRFIETKFPKVLAKLV